ARGAVGVVRKALRVLLRREQHRLVVAAALALAAVERAAGADRHEDVLERRAPRGGRGDVSGRDGSPLQRPGGVAELRAGAHVAALERTLELDVEAVAAEGLREPRRRV